MIWDSNLDIAAAHESLRADPRIDPRRIGMVGASYSGEEMAEAGRMHGYAQAYVALSPGSFSEESILDMDESGGWRHSSASTLACRKLARNKVRSRQEEAPCLWFAHACHSADHGYPPNDLIV